MGSRNVSYSLLQTLLFLGQLFGEIYSISRLDKADDTVLVSYRNLSLTSVPDNIPINVTHLDLSMNSITSISQGAFQMFPNLSSINLSFNRLDRIPNGVLSGSTKHANFAGNNISEIETDTFGGLDKLTHINLSRNVLGKCDFTVLYDAAESLVSLDISYNNVLNIVGSTVSFASLETIYLNNNRLTSLNGDSFLGLGALVNLDLSWNQINNIENQTFSNLSVLDNLDLGHNQLVSLTDNTCLRLNSLTTLNLGFNHLSEIPISCFAQTHNLKTLVLSGNLFSRITDGSFENIHSLTHLDISNCDFLATIDSDAFGPLENLTKLNLANNPILENVESLFGNDTNLWKLQVLLLDSNKQLHTIPSSFLFRLENLKKLSLQHLELQCDCNLKWLKEKTYQSGPLDISVANTTCSNHPSPVSRLFKDVIIEEMVCVGPVIISSTLATQPPNSASIQVTVSNTDLPWITWELPTNETLILGPETHNVSYGNTTTFLADRTILSTVVISSINISSIDEDWYGDFIFTASNMAGNVSRSFTIDKTSFSPSPDQVVGTQLTVALAVVMAALCLVGLVCLINIQHVNKKESEKSPLLDSNNKDSILENGTVCNSSVLNKPLSAGTSEIETIGEISDYQRMEDYENKAYQDDANVNNRHTYGNGAYQQDATAESYENNACEVDVIVESYEKDALEHDEKETMAESLDNVGRHAGLHGNDVYQHNTQPESDEDNTYKQAGYERIEDESTKL